MHNAIKFTALEQLREVMILHFHKSKNFVEVLIVFNKQVFVFHLIHLSLFFQEREGKKIIMFYIVNTKYLDTINTVKAVSKCKILN